MTGAGRGTLPILSAANFVIGMGAFMLVGLLPPLAGDLSVGEAAAGQLLTTYALAYAVLSPLLVALTGRAGRRKVIAAGMALFGAAALWSAVAGSLAELHAARILAAAGAGLTTPVAAAVAAATAAPGRQGQALAFVFFGITLAQVIGVPAGGWLAFTFGWRTAFWTVAGLSLPILYLIWTALPRGLSVPPVGLPDLGRALTDRQVLLTVSFTATFLGAIYVVYTYIATLLAELQGFGRDGITAILLLFGVAAVIGNLVGGRLADRIGPYRTLFLLGVLQIGTIAVWSVLPLAGWVLVVLTLGWSVSGWAFTAPQQLRLVRLKPEGPSVLLSLNAAAIYVGAALGSAIGGAALAGFGPGALGLVGALVALVALLNLWVAERAMRS